MSPDQNFFVLQISYYIIAGSARGTALDLLGCGPLPSVNDNVEPSGLRVPRLFQALVHAPAIIQVTDHDNGSDISYDVTQHGYWQHSSATTSGRHRKEPSPQLFIGCGGRSCDMSPNRIFFVLQVSADTHSCKIDYICLLLLPHPT